MTKVSVIVSVYNAEKTLDKCLESIVNQDLQDIEVICVNDGSKDRSLEILMDFSRQDSRIKIINQENQGPFSVRKNGCLQAKSPYVMFCDSDDWLLPKALTRLYHAIESLDTEVTIARQYSSSNGILTPSFLNNDLLLEFGERPFTLKQSRYALFSAHNSLNAKIFKKSIFLKACNEINTDAKNGEDMLVLFASYLLSEKISLIYDFAYVYKQDNIESLTYRKGCIAEASRSWSLLFKYIDSLNLDDKEYVYDVCSRKYCLTISWLLTRFNDVSGEDRKALDDMDVIVCCSRNSVEYKKLQKGYEKYKHSIILENIIPRIKKTKDFRVLEFLGKRWSFPRSGYKKRLTLSRNIGDIYEQNLKILQIKAQKRKIRVCFYVSEKQKWQTEDLFQMFCSSNRYECFFVFNHNPVTSYEDNVIFFKNYGVPVFHSSEKDPKDFDVIFYQQPWCINKKWQVFYAAKTCLTCYLPYCVYCLDSPNNNINGFHDVLWRYFTDSETDVLSNPFGNKRFLGSTKIESLLKSQHSSIRSGKIKVVYAPHHSFGVQSHRMATWHKFGKEILDLAKGNPEMEWVFRPHPRFDYEVQANRLATFQELHSYYGKWEQVGEVDCNSHWVDLLADCDLLITDCISFLYDFSFTNKPLIHLRSLYQKEAFSENLMRIIDNYMQVYDVDQLRCAFAAFLSNNDKDGFNKSVCNPDFEASGAASNNIFNYLNGKLLKNGEL